MSTAEGLEDKIRSRMVVDREQPLTRPVWYFDLLPFGKETLQTPGLVHSEEWSPHRQLRNQSVLRQFHYPLLARPGGDHRCDIQPRRARER